MSNFCTVWLENVMEGDLIELPNGGVYVEVAIVTELANGQIEVTGRDMRTGVIGPADMEVRIGRRG